VKSLIEFRQPHERFARSINVERDAGSNAVEGYLPTGRAIDAIERLAGALNHDDIEVAFSITGPYGSGKSSLAVVIDALFGPVDDSARKSVDELVKGSSAGAYESIDAARRHFGAHERGFFRAVVTAQREPIISTVLRALQHGVDRYDPAAKFKIQYTKIRKRISILASTNGAERSAIDIRTIRGLIEDLGKIAPVLLLIDEFGKNLEAFADSRSDADLFLLQELAEWSRGGDGLPLALITLQHMAFDEYAESATSSQRREWAKIQGRFEDIVYVDSNAQTRRLISASFSAPAKSFSRVVSKWANEQSEELSTLGLIDLSAESEIVERCWPLHPLSLALLPDLCERYGQNERTLFSFLAGHEPLAIPALMAKIRWDEKSDLPSIRLDHVYDYFVESASTMVGVSAAASRWIEIDTRLRDARGLTDPQLRVLKSVGLLNLISAGGTLRASRELIAYAVADHETGTQTIDEVNLRIKELEDLGVLTYRDFADELRVWQGSDVDLRGLLETARRRVRAEQPSALLTGVLPLSPVVVARHSEEFGVLRAFERGWIDGSVDTIQPLGDGDRFDGSALYCLQDELPAFRFESNAGSRPVAVVTSNSAGELVDVAREVAAIDLVLCEYTEVDEDWVAKRELTERKTEALGLLAQKFESAFGDVSRTRGPWRYVPIGHEGGWLQATGVSASQCLSEVADSWYSQAPKVRNDIVNRHEISSQAAKARRLLVEAMISHAGEVDLGIEGSGPDHTLYLSTLKEFGFHVVENGSPLLQDPSRSKSKDENSILPMWERLREIVQSATAHRVRASDIYRELARPPFGIREGLAPLFLMTWLVVHSDETAVYEHGTFRPVLTMDVIERLFRNPGNFELKYFGSRTGSRSHLLTAIDEELAISSSRRQGSGRVGSVLAVLSHLVALMNSLPDYSKRTSGLSEDAIAIRKCLTLATEPDELIFKAIPEAFGKKSVSVVGKYSENDISEIAQRLAAATSELSGAFPALLAGIRSELQKELRARPNGLRESLINRAKDLQGKALDQRVARFLVALSAEISDDDSWTEYVGMNVAGSPPAAWVDEDRRRFFATIHDLGSTFRRLEALNVDMRSRGEGFEALRVTVTRTDGKESANVVWMDESRRESVQKIVESSIDGLTQEDVDLTRAEARELLMALLAQAEFVLDDTASIGVGMQSPSLAKSERKQVAEK
jgi:hypothetical protein